MSGESGGPSRDPAPHGRDNPCPRLLAPSLLLPLHKSSFTFVRPRDVPRVLLDPFAEYPSVARRRAQSRQYVASGRRINEVAHLFLYLALTEPWYRFFVWVIG